MAHNVQIGAVLTEFLEAIVHQILFLRQVYEPELFERHRLYSIAVRKASHPGVVGYIQKLTHSLKAGLESGSLQKLVIVILDRSSQALEKYVLELKMLQPDRLRRMSPIELEAALRSVLLKLQFMDACLRPLPQGALQLAAAAAFCAVLDIHHDNTGCCAHVASNSATRSAAKADCTFTVLACAKGEASMPIELWAEAISEVPSQQQGPGPEPPTAAPASYVIAAQHEIVPIKTTSVSRALHLQFYVDSSLSTTLPP